MDNKIYINNRKMLFDRMKDSSVVVMSSGLPPHQSADQFYKYTSNRNLFYLTGISVENVRLVMLKDGEKTASFLFIEETNDYIKKWIGKKMTKEEASDLSGIAIENIKYQNSFSNFFKSMMSFQRGIGFLPPKNLYLDIEHIGSSTPITYVYHKEILDNYKELQIENINGEIAYLRMYKNPSEIAEIEKAILYTKNGVDKILSSLKPGLLEYQVQSIFEQDIMYNGSEGVSFHTIAASGKNATCLHYVENNDVLQDNDLMLFDLGALSNNYAADISRTFPINGKFTPRQKEIYNIVLKTNKAVIDYLKPNLTLKEINEYARTILIEETKKIGLIKEDSEISKYYYHSIGHSLGLDVHDVGQFTLPIKEGFVITVEPGLYIEEEGIGVRIEDDVLITKNGAINLSKDIPKEIDDIEAFMEKN